MNVRQKIDDLKEQVQRIDDYWCSEAGCCDFGKRIEALEKHRHEINEFDTGDLTGEPLLDFPCIEPSPPQSAEQPKEKGSFICDSCKKDWGDGSAADIPIDGKRDEWACSTNIDHAGEPCCGESVSVTWHPFEPQEYWCPICEIAVAEYDVDQDDDGFDIHEAFDHSVHEVEYRNPPPEPKQQFNTYNPNPGVTHPADCDCILCKPQSLDISEPKADTPADDVNDLRADLRGVINDIPADTCEHCGGTNIYSGPPDCPRCGAPNCCQDCCKAEYEKHKQPITLRSSEADHKTDTPADTPESMEQYIGCEFTGMYYGEKTGILTQVRETGHERYLLEWAGNAVWFYSIEPTPQTTRLKTAEAKLKAVRDVLSEAPELNMSNYDADEVCELNNAMIEAYKIIDAPEEVEK